MGVFEYPCPACGTAQKVRAPNGTEVQAALCAACTEAEALGRAETKAASEEKKARRA